MSSHEVPESANYTGVAQGIGWRFLWSKRWIQYYVLLLVFAIGCVLLSNWQFARREEARAEIARVDRNYDAPALSIEDVSEGRFSEELHAWRRVAVTGEYAGSAAIVRNRPSTQGSGVELVQAFRVEGGPVVFVDRGWVSGAETLEADYANALDIAAPTGERLQLVLRLRPAEPQISGRTPTEHSVGTINPQDLSGVTGVSTADAAGAQSAADTQGARGGAQATRTASIENEFYGELVSENPEFGHGVLAARPHLDEGPHFSYAVQWIVFIFIAVGGFAYLARQEFQTANEKSATTRARAKTRKHRPTDAEEEDALLFDH